MAKATVTTPAKNSRRNLVTGDGQRIEGTINIQVVSPETFGSAHEASKLLARLGINWMVFNGNGFALEYEQMNKKIEGLRVIRR